MMTINQSTNQ